MKKKQTYILVFAFLFIGTNQFLGQETLNNEKGSVVISESSLESLITLLYAHKAELNQKTTSKIKNSKMKFDGQYDALLDQLVIQQNLKYTSNFMVKEPLTVKEQNKNYELERLEKQLSDLQRNSYQPNTSPTTNVLYINRQNPSDKGAEAEIYKLQMQLDSVYALKSIPSDSTVNGNNNADAIEVLRLQLSNLQADEIDKKGDPTDYIALLETYKSYKKEIYFDNNSFELNADGTKVVNEIFSILKANDNIDVLINGYASNVGLAAKNDRLSMERTEAVKKALVSKGLHPIRIMTNYHGIDYQTANENKARRAEISLIIRK